MIDRVFLSIIKFKTTMEEAKQQLNEMKEFESIKNSDFNKTVGNADQIE